MTVQILGATETMRHVPPIDYLIFKIDGEYREQVDKLYGAAFEAGKIVDPEKRGSIEAGFRSICRSLERLGEIASHHRAGAHHSPQEVLRSRLDHAFLQAMKGLTTVKADDFGRRAPENQFEKSSSESLLFNVLATGAQIRKLIPLVAAANPDIYEMLLNRLVVKEHPIDDETLRPIAT